MEIICKSAELRNEKKKNHIINITSQNLLKKITHCTFNCQRKYVLQAKIIELKNWICRISNVDHGQIVSSPVLLEMDPLLLSFQATTSQACCEVAPKTANLKRN